MKGKYKIAFVTVEDAKDRNSWSGFPFYVKRALERCGDFEILDISPLKDNLKLAYYPYKLALKKFLKVNYLPQKKSIVAKNYAGQIKRKIKGEGVDLVFCVGTVPIAYLEVDVPIVIYSDSCYRATLDYYEYKKCIKHSNRIESDMVEARALKNADYMYFSSQWARGYAISYGIPEEKVGVLHFGAFMDCEPMREKVIRRIGERCKSEICNLVYIGKDWDRKGGDTAYKAYRHIREKMGVDASLTIIGNSPEIYYEGVTRISYIDKNLSEGLKKYEEILYSSHFLILPTKADCTPAVCVETGAYGIPCVVADTGGMASIVSNGENGFLISQGSSEEAYAQAIFRSFEDREGYRKLCMGTREYYEKNIAWENTVRNISEKFKELIEAGRG